LRAVTFALIGLLVPSAARAGDEPPAERSRFQAAMAVGLIPHAGLAVHWAPLPSLALGLEAALSHDAGGTHTNAAGTTVVGVPSRTALSAVAFAKANAFPSRRVAPFAALGYGLGRVQERGASQTGQALTLGLGLDVRLGSRVTGFVEGRLGVIDVLVAGEDPWVELPIRVGVRLKL